MAKLFWHGENSLSRGELGKSKSGDIVPQEPKIKKFAFLVHPRISAREDMGKIFYPFYFFPEIILQKIIPYLNPIMEGKVKFSEEMAKKLGAEVVGLGQFILFKTHFLRRRGISFKVEF